jgi:hypothetical protein
VFCLGIVLLELELVVEFFTDVLFLPDIGMGVFVDVRGSVFNVFLVFVTADKLDDNSSQIRYTNNKTITVANIPIVILLYRFHRFKVDKSSSIKF